VSGISRLPRPWWRNRASSRLLNSSGPRSGSLPHSWPAGHRPDLSGFLCRTCTEAVEATGAIGPTALLRACVASLAPQGVGRLPYGNVEVPGLVGWGVLKARAQRRDPPVEGPKANTRPFEHLGDLEALTEQLSVALS
jgi:hypothetical protein